jgi:RNA polymerase sigma-70 factor (ECF subfamily)
MTGARTAELQLLIDRLRAGDQSARQELINRSYCRLRGLAARLLGEDFPALRAAPAYQQTSDVVNEVAYRLDQALKEVQPPTVRDFLRLAAQRMRFILLDLIKKHGGERERRDVHAGPEGLAWPDRAAESDPSASRAGLARLIEQVERLPDEEREAIELHFFQELPEAEVAELVGVSTKTIDRRLIKAKMKLGDALRPFFSPLPGARGDD